MTQMSLKWSYTLGRDDSQSRALAALAEHPYLVPSPSWWQLLASNSSSRMLGATQTQGFLRGPDEGTKRKVVLCLCPESSFARPSLVLEPGPWRSYGFCPGAPSISDSDETSDFEFSCWYWNKLRLMGHWGYKRMYFVLYKEEDMWGWGDGSARNMLASQAWRPEFHPSNPCRKAKSEGTYLWPKCWGDGDRWIPIVDPGRGHLAGQFTCLVNSSPVRDSPSGNKMDKVLRTDA